MDGRETAIRLERRKIYLAETRMVLRSHHDPDWKLPDDELIEILVAKTYEREHEGPEEARIARRIRELLIVPGAVVRDGNGQGEIRLDYGASDGPDAPEDPVLET